MKKQYLILVNTFLLIVVFLITIVSYGQKSSDIKAIEITNNMKNQLTLTDQQYDQVLEVNKKYLKKLDDSRNENEPGSGVREEFTKIRSEWDSELEKVLTNVQFEKYKENKMKQRPKRVPNNR
ncbi:MAG: hypothetical protein KAR57_01180 [Bacteroidales bacterium]|nr:hypothetical protein [Bacteroidales bacterium]